MFKNFKKYFLIFTTLFLLVFVFILVKADWQKTNRIFTFAMLDVGQGDALFIQSPTGTQVLFDGGPPRKISNVLSKVMSPFDKTIDAIIITNPDQDHIGGFIDVLKNYKVGVMFESGTISNSEVYKNLKNEIKNKKIPNILAKKGMRLDLGGNVFIDILFPDRDVSHWATNDGSTVARLTYKNTSIMLTGDAPMEVEKIILEEFSKEELESDILKVGHHGSSGSSSFKFVQMVSPKYSLLSLGKDNRYGHPQKSTLSILSEVGSKILRTDELGTIIMKINGDMIEWKNVR